MGGGLRNDTFALHKESKVKIGKKSQTANEQFHVAHNSIQQLPHGKSQGRNGREAYVTVLTVAGFNHMPQWEGG